MKELLIALVLFSAWTVHADEEEMEWNWEAGVPHYQKPHYDEHGEVLFFPRIIGGEIAFLGEFPAKISLQTRRGQHFCGGALLDLRHVLSAAHCLTDIDGRVTHPSEIRLMGDDLTIETRAAAAQRQLRYATHIFAHPGYNVDTLANDIAVIRVSVAFTQSPTMRPVPRAQVLADVGTTCHLAGWGVTHEIRVRPHPVLLRVELDIISMAFCNGSSSYNGNIPVNSFCAGTMDGSRDACFGDSGGALMCNGLIAGVVSFGFGCGRRNFPGVYVDVAPFNPWIMECIASNIPHDEIPRPPLRPSSVSVVAPPHMQLLIAITLAIAKLTQNFSDT